MSRQPRIRWGRGVAVACGVGVAVVHLAAGPPAVQVPGEAGLGDRAGALLAQARLSLGGSELAGLSGLRFTATMRRAARLFDGEQQLAGELEVNLELPGSYVRYDTFSLGAASMTRGEGFSGDELIATMRLAGGGSMKPSGVVSPATRSAMLTRLRQDAARLAWGLLVSSHFVPAGFRHAGQAESPDGRAEVIDLAGAGGFAARLFIDCTVHRPLMLTYLAPQLPAGLPGMGTTGAGLAPSAEQFEEMRRQAASVAKMWASSPPAMVEARMYLGDHRQVDGVWLPFRVSYEVGGKVTEEWEVRRYTVNPRFEPGTFSNR